MIDWITEPLSHGATLRALAEVAILGAVSGAVGCWVLLYRISYSAESLAHGMFPGLVGAALLGLPLLAGGAVGILGAALLISLVGRVSDDSADTAIAVVVTSLFGLGALMALSPASPPGVQELLFGDLLGATGYDLLVAAGIATAVIGLLWRFHERLLAIGFDAGSGRALGLPSGLVNAILLGLVAVTILAGVQGLGNLLVAAILVGPAAAARQVTSRFAPMVAVSVGVAVLSGLAGIYVSFYAKTAAGASVVGCLLTAYLICAATSWVIGRHPDRGAHAPSAGAGPVATLNS